MDNQSFLENPYFHLIVILTVCGCGFGCASRQTAKSQSSMLLSMNTVPRDGLRDALTESSESGATIKAQIRTVTFPYDSYELSQDARDILKVNGEIIRAKEPARILIEGHCDELGTTEYNVALGERRAVAVREYYQMLGLSAADFQTISYGKERPLCLDDNSSCHLMNRRARTVID